MEDIKELTMEDLVKQAKEFQVVMDDMEAGIRVIKDELLDRLTKMKLDGTKIGGCLVKKNIRLSFPDISIGEARELGCTEETVSQIKLKALYAKGVKIKARVTQYVTIKEATA